MPVEVGTQDTNSGESNAPLPFPGVVSLEKLSQGQVDWEGDESSVHVSLLNNCPFPRHAWQQVVERGRHANSLSGAASGVRCTGGQSFTLSFYPSSR